MKMDSTPSKKLAHTPTTNDIYHDTRSEVFRRIYIDEEVVFTRSEEKSRVGDRHIHNMMEVETLMNRIDQGRYEYTPDADVDIPKFDPVTDDAPDDEKTSPTSEKESATKSGADTSGQTTPEDTAKITAFGNGTDKTSTNSSNSSTDNAESTPAEEKNGAVNGEQTDWTVVNQISERIQNKLYESGYKTEEDVETATKDDLTDVDGVGPKGAENLKQHISE